MNIQIESATEAFDQRYCTGLGSPLGEPCFFYHMRGDGTVDDAQHLPHDHRPAGEPQVLSIAADNIFLDTDDPGPFG